MVNYLKRAFRVGKGIVKNPERKIGRLVRKADKKIRQNKTVRKVARKVRKVDKRLYKESTKLGLRKQYKQLKNYAAKRSGIGKVLRGKQGIGDKLYKKYVSKDMRTGGMSRARDKAIKDAKGKFKRALS